MEYTDLDKAQWILENGEPQVTWIHERVGAQVYARPSLQPDVPHPPWIPTERQLAFEMESPNGTGNPNDYAVLIQDKEYTDGYAEGRYTPDGKDDAGTLSGMWIRCRREVSRRLGLV